MGKIDPASVRESTLSSDDIVMGRNANFRWSINADGDGTIVLPQGDVADSIVGRAEVLANEESIPLRLLVRKADLPEGKTEIFVSANILNTLRENICRAGGGHVGQHTR